MRKLLLLGASALALGVGASAAYADDPLKVTLSGTGQEWFGYASNTTNDVGAVSKLFSQSNNSFSLNGSDKLDNGITVGVSFTMNASPGIEGGNAHLNTASGTTLNSISYFDQTAAPETNFVSFAGGFGQVAVGWQPNAAMGTSMDAPNFGVGGLSWGRWAGWVLAGTGSNLIQGSGETTVFDDYWANKVVYSTPAFSGIQGTISFTPNMASQDFGAEPTSSAGTGGANNGAWGGDSSSYALTYGGDLGSAKVKAQVAYTNEEFNGLETPGYNLTAGQGGTLNGYQGGATVTFGGFSVGGSVADRVVGGLPSNATTAYSLKTALSQGVTWDLGVSYTTGPWGIAASYYTSQADDNTNTFTNAPTTGTANDNYYGVSFQYTLGPGITVDLENAIVDYKATPGTNGSATVVTSSEAKNDGWFSVLSTTVNF